MAKLRMLQDDRTRATTHRSLKEPSRHRSLAGLELYMQPGLTAHLYHCDNSTFVVERSKVQHSCPVLRGVIATHELLGRDLGLMAHSSYRQSPTRFHTRSSPIWRGCSRRHNYYATCPLGLWRLRVNRVQIQKHVEVPSPISRNGLYILALNSLHVSEATTAR